MIFKYLAITKILVLSCWWYLSISAVGNRYKKLWGYTSHACCRERYIAWDGEDSEEKGSICFMLAKL
jgi:hypothetical protein